MKKLLMYNMDRITSNSLWSNGECEVNFFSSLTRKAYTPNRKTIEDYLATIPYHRTTNNSWCSERGIKDIRVSVASMQLVEEPTSWYPNYKYKKIRVKDYADEVSIELFDTDSYFNYFNEHKEIDYLVIQDMYTLVQLINKTDEELGRITIDNTIIACYDAFEVTYNGDIKFIDKDLYDYNYESKPINIYYEIIRELDKEYGIKLVSTNNRIFKALAYGYSKALKKNVSQLNAFSLVLLPLLDDKDYILKTIENYYKTLTKTKVDTSVYTLLLDLINNKKLDIEDFAKIIFKSKSKKNYEVLAELFDLRSHTSKSLFNITNEEDLKTLVTQYKDYIISGNYMIGIETVTDYLTKEDLKKINKSEVALMAKTSPFKYSHTKEFKKLLDLLNDTVELDTPGIRRFKQMKTNLYPQMSILSMAIDAMTIEEVESIKTEVASMILSQVFAQNENFGYQRIIMTNIKNFEIIATEVFDQLATDTNKRHIEKYLNNVVYQHKELNPKGNITVAHSPLADMAFCSVEHKSVQKLYVNKTL